METIVIITASIITIGWLIVFSFIATRVPWFCRGREEGERWEKQTPVQRFFGLFIPGFIGLLFILILYALRGIYAL